MNYQPMKRHGRTCRVKEADLKGSSNSMTWKRQNYRKSEEVGGYQRLRGKEG